MSTDVAADPVTEPEIPFAEPPAPDAPIEHSARCVECGDTVHFIASASGSGFSLVTHDTDQVYGIGSNGRPICPNGHGEMEIADDAIPVAEAIDEVARLQQAQQGDLPGIIPPFNYQAAYLELESKAVEVDELHREYVDAAEAARDAKKGWDKAAELFTKMAIEFQRRRREKVAAGEPVADVDPTRCTFEQLHPDQTCPICESDAHGLSGLASPTAAQHAEEAQRWLDARAETELMELLEDAAQIVVPVDVVRGWTDEQRAELTAYAVAVRDEIDPLPARPACLGAMHVAGSSEDGTQRCTQCDVVLIAHDAGEDVNYYMPGWLVGTDCKGKIVEPHRYPKRGTKKATKPAAPAKPAARAKAKAAKPRRKK